MLYAGAKELMRNTAEVGKVIEIDSADDLEELPQKLGAAWDIDTQGRVGWKRKFRSYVWI
jgi:hypothetical protein